MNATFIPLEPLSSRLGLPVAWLRREADAGRLPFLQVGQRRVFDIHAVRRVLAERAAEFSSPEREART